MQLVLTLDWVSISSGVVAVLSLVASIFSALGAASSADVALKAESRIAAGERKAAERELLRSIGKIENEALIIKEVLVGAIRTAESNSSFYASSENLRLYALTNIEIQQRIDHLTLQSNHGLNAEQVQNKSDEWIAQTQIAIDRILTDLSGEKEWAINRAEQLLNSNKNLADDLTREEQARGVFQRRNADGKLV